MATTKVTSFGISLWGTDAEATLHHEDEGPCFLTVVCAPDEWGYSHVYEEMPFTLDTLTIENIEYEVECRIDDSVGRAERYYEDLEWRRGCG